MPAVRWVFYSLAQFLALEFCEEYGFREMDGALARTRKAFLAAVCALILPSFWGSASSARQSSTGDPSAKASSSTTTPDYHTSTAKASLQSSSKTNSSSKTHKTSTGKRSSRRKSTRARGQQKIDPERAEAIQEALIREHYLTGEATGTWNQASEEAMRRYQADHGWQSKTVPDSRALIKLGLGPSKDHLLNPDSAMTTVPDTPKAAPEAPKPASEAAKSESTPSVQHTAPAADPATGASRARTDPSGPQ